MGHGFIQKILHPSMWTIIYLLRKDEMIVLHRENLSKVKQAIYIANHSNGNDFPTLGEVIKKPFYILADYTMKKDFFVNLANVLNGCIYVDRLDKGSKEQAKKRMIELLREGKNVLLFPEGTWNLHSSKVLLPLNWGVIDLSLKTQVPIIPIAICYEDGRRVCNVGKPIRFEDGTDKKIAIVEIEEILGKLIWEASEKLGVKKRNVLPQNIYDRWRRQALDTYKRFDVEYEASCIRSE